MRKILPLGLSVVLFGLSQTLLSRAAEQNSTDALQLLNSQIPGPAVEDLVDEGDYFYQPGGGKFHLLRVRNEVVVKHALDDTNHHRLTRLETDSGAPKLKSVTGVKLPEKGTIEVITPADHGATLDAKALGRSAAVTYAYPVLVEPKTRTRVLPTDEVLARLADGVTPDDVHRELSKVGLAVVKQTDNKRLNVYLLRLNDPKNSDSFTAAQRLSISPKIRWAEPNFMHEIIKCFTPNDPLYPKQQNLHNTGANLSRLDADVDAPEAWDITRGTNSIVIAIIDDGVDTSHPDLTIFHNPGETGNGREDNGIDDDGNGKEDDWRGWNFFGNDNDPNPVGRDGHGTACAGVAAAKGNNALAVSGMAPSCRVLPVKVAQGILSAPRTLGDAICYAAKLADILSMSFGAPFPLSNVSDELQDALANGRQGKGCLVFAASGNFASTWNHGGIRTRVKVPAGSYYVEFFFQQGTQFQGDNAVGIDNVCLLESDAYTIRWWQSFEGPSFPPSQWRASTIHGAWSASAENPCVGSGGQLSARTPPLLAAGEWAGLLSPLQSFSGNETLAFDYSFSCGANCSNSVRLLDPSDYHVVTNITLATGTNSVFENYLHWPSSFAPFLLVMAVGACTDQDRRADYSQYHDSLDFVVPSNGGLHEIAALDPVGAIGRTPADTNMSFGGTSAACPLAAGIGALLLSANPDLDAITLRAIMRNTCDKIGGVTYDANGRHREYGSGRVNARAALLQVRAELSITQTESTDPVTAGDELTYTLRITNSGPALSGSATVTDKLPANSTFLSASPSDGVWSEQAGILVWEAGEMDAGDSATLSVRIIPHAAGSITNDVTVRGNALEPSLANNSNRVTTIVNPGANQPPNITDIADQVIDANTATSLLSFTIGDPETQASSLTVSGSSSNPSLAPNANIVFGGSGSNRTVRVTPVLSQTGSATITIIVRDANGATDSTSFGLTVLPAAALTTFVSKGSTWRYLDTGTNLGTTWTADAFNDGNWDSGPAPLGYNDSHIVTPVKFGLNPNNKHITTYFRHNFNVPNPAAFSNLAVRLLRDDGAVVYLNGMEVFRSNLPDGPIGYLTLATTVAVGTDETTFFGTVINPGLLRAGVNVVAVEVHQQTNTSTDLGFDLDLLGNVPAPRLSAPHRLPTSQMAMTLNGIAGRAYEILATANLPSGPWTNLATVSNATGTVQFSDPGSTTTPARFYRARLVP